jgi:hypothetical protein
MLGIVQALAFDRKIDGIQLAVRQKGGRLSTVDLFIKLACLTIKVNNISI